MALSDAPQPKADACGQRPPATTESTVFDSSFLIGRLQHDAHPRRHWQSHLGRDCSGPAMRDNSRFEGPTAPLSQAGHAPATVGVAVALSGLATAL